MRRFDLSKKVSVTPQHKLSDDVVCISEKDKKSAKSEVKTEKEVKEKK